MLRNPIMWKKLSANVLIVALAIIPIAYSSQPTTSAFIIENTHNATINLKTWLVGVNVIPGLLDGNCAKVYISPNTTVYKNITFQYSRNANMSSPISRTMIVGDPTQETSIQLTALDGNATYYYRARANDAYRVDWSDIKSFTTTSAIAPGQYFNCD